MGSKPKPLISYFLGENRVLVRVIDSGFVVAMICFEAVMTKRGRVGIGVRSAIEVRR